jgi:hypothetical protein
MIPKRAWPEPPIYQTCKPYSFMRTVGLKGNSPTLFKKVLEKKSTFTEHGKLHSLCFNEYTRLNIPLTKINFYRNFICWRKPMLFKVMMSNGHLKRYYFEKCQVTSCLITMLIFHSGVVLWVLLTALEVTLRNVINTKTPTQVFLSLHRAFWRFTYYHIPTNALIISFII